MLHVSTPLKRIDTSQASCFFGRYWLGICLQHYLLRLCLMSLHHSRGRTQARPPISLGSIDLASTCSIICSAYASCVFTTQEDGHMPSFLFLWVVFAWHLPVVLFAQLMLHVSAPLKWMDTCQVSCFFGWYWLDICL